MNTVNQLKFSVWEIIKRFARVSLLRIFPAVNQSLSYGCYNNRSLDNAWSRTKVVANQFIGSKLRNKVVTNKSLCTVCASTVYTIQPHLHSNFYHSLYTHYTLSGPSPPVVSSVPPSPAPHEPVSSSSPPLPSSSPLLPQIWPSSQTWLWYFWLLLNLNLKNDQVLRFIILKVFFYKKVRLLHMKTWSGVHM